MNLVITQALATGLPVITTYHSGLPDQVKNDVNGWLVNEGDYQALAEKIIYFIDHPEKWGGLSLAARAHALAHYDQPKLLAKQIALYQQMLNHDATWVFN